MMVRKETNQLALTQICGGLQWCAIIVKLCCVFCFVVALYSIKVTVTHVQIMEG